MTENERPTFSHLFVHHGDLNSAHQLEGMEKAKKIPLGSSPEHFW